MNAVRFYTKNGNGERQPIGGVNELTARISDGSLRGDSELYDELIQRWGFVRDHDVFISLNHAGTRAGLEVVLQKLLAFPQLRLVLAAILIVLAVTVIRPTGDTAASVGYSLGSSLIATLLSWPLLRTASKRRGLGVIVFLGVGIASLGSGAAQRANERRERVSRTLAQLRTTIDSGWQAQTGSSIPDYDSVYPPITGTETYRVKEQPALSLSASESSDFQRLALVMKDIRSAIEAHGRLQGFSRFGIDIDVPPPEWLEIPYTANASRYPHVGEYWKGYAGYLDFWVANGGRITDSIISAEVNRLGVSESFAVEVREGAAKSFNRDIPAYALALRSTRTALSLHRALVSFDDELSVSADGNQWTYKSDDTFNAIQRRMALLTAQSDSVTKAFAARQAERSQQLKALERAIR